MDQQQFKVSQLGRRTGLNPGTISSILNGHKLIAVDQLDRVTSVMGLEEGYFYSQYIQESMVDAPPNWRRLKPLLFRCAELNRLDCTQRIVNLLLDNLTYSPLLFETAEELRDLGELAAAALLYEGVALSERSQHSERLALCQYRLFTLRLGEDQAKNLEAAIHFEPYVERLDEINQLDALKELANAYRSLRRWNKVFEVAQKMLSKASIIYNLSENPDLKRKEQQKKMGRPLFFYIAYANLLLSNVYDEQGDYEQAINHIGLYSDLSWVKETHDEALRWKSLFMEWAEANKFVSRLMSGEETAIPEYVVYLRLRQEEQLPGLLNILQAANKFEYNIDQTLKGFEDDIQKILKTQSSDIYNKQIVSERISRLLYELSRYLLRNENYKTGMEYLLRSLKSSVTINNETSILKCIRLFEKYRGFSSSEITLEYHYLVTEE